MFQSPCGDYVGGNIDSLCILPSIIACFSPLAGIMLAETRVYAAKDLKLIQRFSPLAGIMLAETTLRFLVMWAEEYQCFSPLAGIMLAETKQLLSVRASMTSFSPLAGIMLAETPAPLLDRLKAIASFSPLAGIMLAETQYPLVI